VDLLPKATFQASEVKSVQSVVVVQPASGSIIALGELFLSGKYNQASAEYRASLASDPNRFTALLGAARAAERLGERHVAGNDYRAVLGNCSRTTWQEHYLMASLRGLDASP
jgi:hypothetical protein